MLTTGDKFGFSQRDMDGLVSSGILTLTVQGMDLSAQIAAESVPELIEVRSFSGYELKVLDIKDGEWTMEVTKEADSECI